MIQVDHGSRPRTPAAAIARRVILLDGGIRPPELAGQLGRSSLDLPVDERHTVLDRWALDASSDQTEIVCLQADSQIPGRSKVENARVRTIRDTSSYRGPAGIIRDARDQLGLEGVWIIGESTRVISGGVDELLALHHSAGADVTVGVNPDGTLSGMFAVDLKWADAVPARGFLDLKEQWLPKIASKGGKVMPVQFRATAHQVRTRMSYITALDLLGAFHNPVHGFVRTSVRGHPTELAESGALVAESAKVAESAVVCRSVICPGAVVEEGAVVVRSVVGHGAYVPRGSLVIQGVVPASRTAQEESEPCLD